MVYSQYFTREKEPKVPAVLLLGVLLAIIVFLTKIFGNSALPSKAAKNTVRRIEIANIAPNQVTIFWQTLSKERGWLVFGDSETELHKIVLDDRDVENKKNAYLNHLSTIKSLTPAKKYYFKLISENKLIAERGDKAFSFQTPDFAKNTPHTSPAYGKVLGINQLPLTNATVIISYRDAYAVVGMTTESGEWLLPLGTLFHKIKGSELHPAGRDMVDIEIYSEDDLKSTIKSDVMSLSPLPQSVIIGKDYTFSHEAQVLAVNDSRLAADTPRIDILFPKDGGVIPGSSPLLKGTALPNHQVVITIAATTLYTYRTTANADGIWQVQMNDHLPDGEQAVTMETTDELGKEVTRVRHFTIAKSGEQVLGTATPEASPTLSLPVQSATPTAVISRTTTPPVTGANIFPLVETSAALILVGMGIIIAF
ncbi:hypothetical protein HY214_02650 [Candidatus Roizmanbacteria bacterium]|nr:hypothetical protein [Candidatus Roizmanbacteria bacterium]